MHENYLEFINYMNNIIFDIIFILYEFILNVIGKVFYRELT